MFVSAFFRRSRLLFGAGLCLFLGVLGPVACSQPQIKPLNEAIFRLDTRQQPSDCDPVKGGAACRWEIEGRIVSFGITAPNENPFQNCSTCRFNQKFGIEDKNKTIHYVYYKLPTEEPITLTNNANVSLLYLDGSQIGQGYALRLNSNKETIFAVASGAGGNLLNGKVFAPVSVTVVEGEEAGREEAECGTKVFRYLRFSDSNSSGKLAPGQVQNLTRSQGASYRIANINRFNWQNSKCTDLGATPFSFFFFQRPQ